MCINCNLIVPLTDKGADLINVPRRKYLVLGHTIERKFSTEETKYLKEIEKYNNTDKYDRGFSNQIINWQTISGPNKIGINYIPPLLETELEKDGVKLYESKIKIYGKIPIYLKLDNILIQYNELFIDDIEYDETITEYKIPKFNTEK
jgi:hypothetical protein